MRWCSFYVCVLLFFCVQCCVLLQSWATETTTEPPSPAASALTQKSNLLPLIKAFTSYHSYFQGHSPFMDGICIRYANYNESSVLLEEMMQSCPNQRYKLRNVSRSQITWKPHQKANKDVANNATKDSPSTSNHTAEDIHKENTTDKIHPFLAFALLLPDHPFSNDVQHMLHVVAPMYPSVTIIYGNAYEFGDVSSKYLVHNFPKILLFKNGMYVGDYVDSYDESSFAAYFLVWTKQHPKSIPAAIRKPIPLSSISYMKIETKLLQGIDLSIIEKIPLPTPNLEPFLGTLEQYRFWDRLFFFICGIYLLIRVKCALK